MSTKEKIQNQTIICSCSNLQYRPRHIKRVQHVQCVNRESYENDQIGTLSM